MTIFDITLPLSPALAVWPGDIPVSLSPNARIEAGEPVNLSSMTASLHAGSHADAPFHVNPNWAAIESAPLEAFIGRAVVVDVSGRETITVSDLAAAMSEAPRVLLKTGAWPQQSRFPDRIPVIEAGCAEALAERGVLLIGVDVPSVDALDSADLPNHHALGRLGIQILESLDLSGVEPGVYQLAALPLRVVGGDAAPVRAVLWR